jgi:hypothetical protein
MPASMPGDLAETPRRGASSLDVENHHNFAWKETHETPGGTREVIVHRKGATPAGKRASSASSPASMASPAYIVRGLGNPDVPASPPAHGAGRVMSRRTDPGDEAPGVGCEARRLLQQRSRDGCSPPAWTRSPWSTRTLTQVMDGPAPTWWTPGRRASTAPHRQNGPRGRERPED